METGIILIPPRRPALRMVWALLVLAVCVAAGVLQIGPAPAIGPTLDPLNGIWAVARRAELPRVAAGRIPGLSARADVRYDSRDVPHIFAASEADAYRALGYVVARDRLFQIELQTRAGAGTLTELVGRQALGVDRETREMGMPRAAEQEMAAMDSAPADLQEMRAYADGVNAWIDQMSAADLPIEYRLLGRKPRHWSPIDALHLLNRMSATLSLDDVERRRRRAAEIVGDSAARALFPVHSPLQQPIVPSSVPGLRMRKGALPAPGEAASGTELDTTVSAGDAAGESFAGVPGAGHRPDDSEGALGSNNWAVSPRRTKAGYALLAGDPHLDMTLPSLWYEVHLVVPGQLDVAGVTIPGGPGVILGFTRDVAWTFTNTGADVTDFYVEHVDDPKDPRRYLVDGAWRPLEMRTEVYRGPRDEVLVTDTVRYTHRGPMRLYAGRWISMRWTALESRGAFGALRAAPHARTTAEWLRATQGYDVPAQNMLVADRAGSIAIRSTGHYPVRPGDGRGDLERDGSKSSSDWTGVLPLDRYPASVDPAQGYLASDNQEPTDPDMPNPLGSAYLGANWESPWRAARINTLLRADSTVTPDDMRRWQTDPGSARADYFVPYFLDAARRADSAGRASADLRTAARLLGEWDRRYTRDNERAVLFESAMTQLTRRAWTRLSAGGGKADAPVVTPPSSVLAELLNDPTSAWWNDPRTPGVQTRDDVLAASLVAGLAAVDAGRGPPERGGWRWSQIRHANIHHLLFIPAFSRLGLPVQSGTETLSPSSGDGVLGPSWRMVVQLGPEVHGWATYPGGQSGNPASARYANRLPQWLAGTLDSVRMPHAPNELAPADVKATLTLEPAR